MSGPARTPSPLQIALDRAKSRRLTNWQAEHTPAVILMRDSREAAEAAGPPSAEALAVLHAARVVHRSQKAQQSASNPDELAGSRYALAQAETALGALLDQLADGGESPN